MSLWPRDLSRHLGGRLGRHRCRPQLPIARRPLRLEAGTRLWLPAARAEKLSRPALILKADDFGGPLNAAACDFVERLAAAGGVAGLGVITSRLAAAAADLGTYQRLHEFGFELWLHGHRHLWQRPGAEFEGASLAQQTEALATGLARAEAELGVRMCSFGAPGNAVDASTATALGRFPRLRVWLFGDPARAAEAGAVVLPRLLELEPVAGEVAAPEAFLAAVDRLLAAQPELEVLTLQVHPFVWTRRSLGRFATILPALTRRFRLTTPDGWWRWLRDRDSIVVQNVTVGVTSVDGGAAGQRHVLALADGG